MKSSVRRSLDNQAISAEKLSPSRRVVSPRDRKQSRSKADLKLVNPSLERRRFTVHSTTPSQRFLSKLDKLSKLVTHFAIIGLVGAAASYACMASLEFKVSQELKSLEVEIKNREDLKSYVSRAYSWENLYARAKKSHLLEVDKVEIATIPKSVYHLANND